MSPRGLSDAERQLLTHVGMWGSEGYPVRRQGRGWVWGTDSVPGPPTIFKTKREAVASFEAFERVLQRAKFELEHPDQIDLYDRACRARELAAKAPAGSAAAVFAWLRREYPRKADRLIALMHNGMCLADALYAEVA